MYANSTACTPIELSFNQDTLPSSVSTSTTPVLYQLHTGIQPPVLKNKLAKYAGLPDKPDLSGIRDRREQDQMALCELQRSRGIEPPENPHTVLLEAYGYRQLMQLVFDIPSMSVMVMSLVCNTMTLRIGPPGADAASSVSIKNPIAKKLLIEEFIKKFQKSFEIWRSVLAKKN